MKKFNVVKEKYIERLNLYVPVVDRVHGKEHPEFHEVQRLYLEISGKMKNKESSLPDLNEEFKELRKVTDNYKVPEDTCESYEAVYHMLAELDQAYNVE